MQKTSSNARTSGKARAQPVASGKIGIFWVYHGKLLATAFGLNAGMKYGDALNGPTDHVKYWPVFQARYAALRDLEYQDVPRGRVLFMQPTRQFRVYMDKTLHKTAIKSALRKAFSLPASRTHFLTDAHYTTDEQELNQLFSQ